MAKKHRFTVKEHRQVEHIKESEEARGYPEKEAEAIGYATVNKEKHEAEREAGPEREDSSD